MTRVFLDSAVSLDGFDTEDHVPHFILTHTPRPSAQRGGTRFHFVTDGPESALARTRTAAGDRDVCVAGGAAVTPVLLGGGLRLFTAAPPARLEHVRTVQSAHATHVTYRITEAPRA